MANVQFNPPESIAPFLAADKFIDLIVGPVGSTKTTASLMKIAYEAKRVEPCHDGIRRSRCAVVRNTNQQLDDTTIPDFMKWFPEGEAGTYARTGKRFFLRFDDVECEVIFRGLDDQNDVRRLLSLQLSFAFMDEFREIHPDIFNALRGRLGRYPDKSMNGVGCATRLPDGEVKQIHKIWGSSNPPDMDTFWENYLSAPPENCHVTIQPSGLSPEADWLHFLPDGYYENLCLGASEDWIDVFVHAKFGRSLQGKPVFRCFDKATHVHKTTLMPNRVSANPLIVGFDCTGLNPAAAIGQLGFEGRLMVYAEVVSSDMGAIRFIREKLKPLLANRFAGMPALVVIDPAGMARGADERNVADMLKAEGFRVIPARTNGISARVAAVEQFLTRSVDGKPAFLLDPSCKVLAEALRSKYRYKINTKGEADDTPEKTHPWADVVDGLQYLCLHADGGALFAGAVGAVKREIKPSPVRWAVC